MSDSGYRSDREAARARLETLREELREREARLSAMGAALETTEKPKRRASRRDRLKEIVSVVLLIGIAITLGSRSHHNSLGFVFLVALIALHVDLRSKSERIAEQGKLDEDDARLADQIRAAHQEREKWRFSCAEKESEIADAEALLATEEQESR